MQVKPDESAEPEQESDEDVDLPPPVDDWLEDDRAGYVVLGADNPLRLMRRFASGFAAQRSGDRTGALAMVEPALAEARARWREDDPGLILGYATLAHAYHEAGEPDRAREAVDKGLAAIAAHPERAIQVSAFKVRFLLLKAELAEAKARAQGGRLDPLYPPDSLKGEAARVRAEALRERRLRSLAPGTPFFNFLTLVPGLQPVVEWAAESAGPAPSPLADIATAGSVAAALIPAQATPRDSPQRYEGAVALVTQAGACMETVRGASEAGDFRSASLGSGALLDLVTERNLAMLADTLALPRDHERRAGLEEALEEARNGGDDDDDDDESNDPDWALTVYAQGRLPELGARIERTLTPRVLLKWFKVATKSSDAKTRKRAAGIIRNHHAALGKGVVYLRTALVMLMRPAEARDVRTMAEAGRWLAGPGGKELRTVISKVEALKSEDPEDSEDGFADSRVGRLVFRWAPAVFDSFGWSAAHALGDVRAERSFTASIFNAYRSHLEAEQPGALTSLSPHLSRLQSSSGSVADRSLQSLPPVLAALNGKPAAAAAEEEEGDGSVPQAAVNAAVAYFLIPMAARAQRWADIVRIGDPVASWALDYLNDEYGNGTLDDLGEVAGQGPAFDLASQPWAHYLYALESQRRGTEAVSLLDRAMPAIRAVENRVEAAGSPDRTMTRPELAALIPDSVLYSAIVVYAAHGRQEDATLLARIRARKTQLSIGATSFLAPPDPLVGLRLDETRQIYRPPFEQLIGLADLQPDGPTKWNDVLMAMDGGKQTPAGDVILLRALAEGAAARAGKGPMEAYGRYMAAVASRKRAGRPDRLFRNVAGSPEEQAREVVESRAALIAQVKSALPEASAALPGEITMDRLREALRPGELIVGNMVVGDRIAILTVTREAPPRLVWSPASYAELVETIGIVEDRFTLPAEGYDPAQLIEPEDELETLYAALVAPVEQEVRNASHIVWSPDLRLAAVPVVALRSRSVLAGSGAAPTPYLGLAKPISVSPRLGGFVMQRELPPRVASGLSLAVGDIPFRGRSRDNAAHGGAYDGLRALLDKPPTPGARAALQTFVDVTGGRALTGAEANLQSLAKFGDRPLDLLMFYTHGLGNPGQLGPALILSPSPADPDPRLGQADILALGIRPRFVLLAACSTGESGRNGVEPYGGVVMGFLAVGAQAVLSAQGRVDEAAVALLTKDLTRGLVVDKLPPSEALRVAQRRLAGDERFRNSVLWAQLVWVGDGART